MKYCKCFIYPVFIYRYENLWKKRRERKKEEEKQILSTFEKWRGEKQGGWGNDKKRGGGKGEGESKTEKTRD